MPSGVVRHRRLGQRLGTVAGPPQLRGERLAALRGGGEPAPLRQPGGGRVPLRAVGHGQRLELVERGLGRRGQRRDRLRVAGPDHRHQRPHRGHGSPTRLVREAVADRRQLTEAGQHA